MYVDRKDFTDVKICKYCKHPLKLGIAYIVVEDSGSEVPAGPVCAGKQASIKGVPDFTKAASYAEHEIEAANEADAVPPITQDEVEKPVRDSERSDANQESRRKILSMVYLRLRQERMCDFKNPLIQHQQLELLWKKYLQGTFVDEDYAQVERIIEWAERKHPLLTLDSLQTAYAYHRILKRLGPTLPPIGRPFFESVDSDLLKKIYITEKQITGVNRWLENPSHGINVRLKPCKAWRRFQEMLDQR